MKKIMFILVGFIILIVVNVLIQKETVPSDKTRIILEHSEQTYIAPPCFEEANASNFLQESYLQEAYDLNYVPHDTCTEEALQGEKDFLFIRLLKNIGIIDKKWDNW